MPDGPRKVQPVRFLDDPRIPTQGLRDFTPKYTPVDAAQEPEQPPESQSSVYGGRRKPSKQHPVAMDDKHLPEDAVGSQEPAQEPGQDQAQDKSDKSTQTGQDSSQTGTDQASQAGSGFAGKSSQRETSNENDSRVRAEGNGDRSPTRKKQTKKRDDKNE